MGKDGLTNLENLLKGGPQAAQQQEIDDPERAAEDEQAMDAINKVLKCAGEAAGASANPPTGDIFDMQELLAACQEELRHQVRELMETLDGK